MTHTLWIISRTHEVLRKFSFWNESGKNPQKDGTTGVIPKSFTILLIIFFPRRSWSSIQMSDGGPALKCYVILNDVIVDILTHPFLQVTHSCPRQECWSRQPIRIAHFEVRKHFSLDSFMPNRHQGCVNPIHCHPINQSFPSRPIKKLQTVTHRYCIKCMSYLERRCTFDCWIFAWILCFCFAGKL